MTLPTPNIYDAEHDRIQVALCQIHTEEWAVEDNWRRTLASLQEAAERGAELAITPECVIHGYGSATTDQIQAKTLQIAEHIEGRKMQEVRQLAQRHKLNIVLGFAEKDDRDLVYNSAVLLTKDGGISYVYRKVHCRFFEDIKHTGAFTAGEDFYVRKVPFARQQYEIGTLICFDREVTESVRCLRRLGAELIACPLATDTVDMLKMNSMNNEVLTRCRAAENEVFIAVVNHAGRFNGGSFIVGPGGEVLCQMSAQPGTEIVEVPIGCLSAKFHHEPLGWGGSGYWRPEIYQKYYPNG